LAILAAASPAHADFAVRDGQLVERDGAPFIMRGVNVPHAWLSQETERAIPAIAATGANTVRIVLSTGARWRRSEPAEVARLVALAKAHGMIAMLEVHDTTGFGADERAVHLGATLGYWAELLPVLEGEEDFVLVNIGNEPFAGRATPAMYVEAHRTAIAALRAIGYRHTIVIDGADYGQDHTRTMLTNARDLFDSDPLKNVLFSVHMYQVYRDGEAVRAYFDGFRDAGLPFIVGEFGMDHQGEPVDEETIFALSAERGVGYLGWSWSGNAQQVADLDIVLDFDPARLSPWGERLINGEGGIRATSRRARIFEADDQRSGFWRRAWRWVTTPFR
jgi:mannan endo-1,4-beta-mannosidase